MKSLLRILPLAGALSCVSASPEAGRIVRVVHSSDQVAGCYLIGTSTPPGSPQGFGWFKQDAFDRGGDTLLTHGLMPSEVYACSPERIAAQKAGHAHAEEIQAAAREVRITNRQDVVAGCKFAGNVTADSEENARTQTAAMNANVFFVISDTSRTAIEKQAGSSTTYNYEVRRLTGEAYSCEAR